MVVHKGGSHYEDVKYLMALEPDIKLARPDSFWNSAGVYNSTRNIQDGHQHKPMKSSIIDGCPETISDDIMHGRYGAT